MLTYIQFSALFFKSFDICDARWKKKKFFLKVFTKLNRDLFNLGLLLFSYMLEIFRNKVKSKYFTRRQRLAVNSSEKWALCNHLSPATFLMSSCHLFCGISGRGLHPMSVLSAYTRSSLTKWSALESLVGSEHFDESSATHGAAMLSNRHPPWSQRGVATIRDSISWL